MRRFQVASQCNAPQGTTISVVPPGAVGVGRTYVIGWKEAPGLDGDGSYLVERSRDAGFSSILDSQSTAGLFASFTTSQQGPHYHRVRAIAGCDPARSGPTSPVVDVPIVSGNASVVFTLQPASAIVGRGDSLASRRSVFAIENITAAPLQVRLSRTATRTPFFTVTDTSGSPVETVTLEPGQPRTLEVRFSGPPADRAGAYEGLLVLSAVGSALPVTPFATVSLKVAPDAVALPGVRPTFRMAGKTVDEVAFPGLLGDDAGRPPIAVEIVNPGTAPLEIAGEIGPEGWLVAESDWNATPIPPGGARTVRLFTQRERAPQGSPLPRYTYFTVRTQAGETARLLVQDSGPLSQGTGRTSSLPPGARSFIIPTVSHVTSASGNTFVSKIVLSNVGTLETQVTLFFTPRNADGFDATQVRQATVLVKPNDVVSLADPLVRLFGMTPPISGQLEVRAPAERIGLLNVHSSIEATARAGGSFGFQMPTVVRGEGARQGDPHTIPGVAITSAFRTNLILAETSGNDGASVSVTLHDRNGVAISRRQDAVPRYGQIQYSLRDLAAGNPIEAGRLVLDVVSGGGTVIGVTTVIDNVNDDTATFISRPLEDATPSRRAFERLSNGALQTEASGTTSFVVPAVVNGFPTFPGTELPYKFRSMMGFVSGTGSPSVFRLTYRDLVAGTTLTRTVTVPARRTLEYANVLEELFGVPAGARSEGPVFVEADKNGFVYCKVYSNVGEGTLGDILPIIAVPSEALTGGGSARPIYADGLEQSVDGTRGTRSNLILNEVTGQPATVVVRLYEAANRGYPIAEQEITLEGLEKRQLSSVFRVLGLQTEERRKDRTNVLCVVTARAGPGLVSAVVSTIDNKTGDLRHTLLTPNGGVSSGGSSIGF